MSAIVYKKPVKIELIVLESLPEDGNRNRNQPEIDGHVSRKRGVIQDLLGHMGRVTSGLMMGIFRFLLAAELMASLSLPEWASPWISSGLGGRWSPDGKMDAKTGTPGAGPAVEAANKVHPLDILRVAVGEG